MIAIIFVIGCNSYSEKISRRFGRKNEDIKGITESSPRLFYSKNVLNESEVKKLKNNLIQDIDIIKSLHSLINYYYYSKNDELELFNLCELGIRLSDAISMGAFIEYEWENIKVSDDEMKGVLARLKMMAQQGNEDAKYVLNVISFETEAFYCE